MKLLSMKHFVKRLMNGEMEELPTAKNLHRHRVVLDTRRTIQKGEISPQLKQRHEKNVKHAPATTASGQTGGRFLRGGLDEELEHKKFAAAVDAWRTGKTQEKAKSPTRDIAKQLNKQMEEARVRRIEKFDKEKHALAQEMQKAKDELAMRKAKALEKIAAEKSKVASKPSEPKTDYSKIWDIEIEY